jgi:uncharacterized protein YndB with AHSA1/START domain
MDQRADLVLVQTSRRARISNRTQEAAEVTHLDPPDATAASTAVVQRILPAPPDVVFEHWIDPDALAEWMCPRPARATNVELDPTVGGRLRIDIEEDGVEFYVVGRFLELERPHRLRFTWSCSTWTDPDRQSIVSVSLEPHGGVDTLMTIQHMLLPEGTLENHQHGWNLIAEQLGLYLHQGAADQGHAN